MFNKLATAASRSLMITGLSTIMALAGGTAWAATQGSVGTTSTGTVDLQVTIGTLARISDLDDLDLGQFTGSGDLSDNDDVCVWSSGSSGYNITGTGSGTGGAFTLGAGAELVTYTVEWASTSGQTTGSSLTSGSALTGQTTAATSTDCNAGASPSASLIVKVAESEMLGKSAAAFTGTLTLVVAPE